MGLVEDKVIKNHYASEYIYNCYKDSQTVGVFEHDEAGGISKIYEPIGVLAPAIIDETADIKMAVSSILLSKNFDYGTICASEQTVIVMESIYAEVKKEFIKRGAYLLSPDETEKIRKIILVDGRLNPKQVGRAASYIASLAGFKVPEETKVLIGEIESVELEEEFSHEKLSTVLGMYMVKTFDEALAKVERLAGNL